MDLNSLKEIQSIEGSSSAPSSPTSSQPPTGVMSKLNRLVRRLSVSISDIKTRGVPAKLKSPPIYDYDKYSGILKIGGVSAQELVTAYQTPLYVYDGTRIAMNYQELEEVLREHAGNNYHLSYDVRINSSLGILDLFRNLGSSFNVVSGGELTKCLTVGIESNKILFTGVGKTVDEINYAICNDIYCINIETKSELDRVEEVARSLGKIQKISIRVNINSDLNGSGGTFQTTKLTGGIYQFFGIPLAEVPTICSEVKASSHLNIIGLSCYVGAGPLHLDNLNDARDKLLDIVDGTRTDDGLFIEHINFQGVFSANGSMGGAAILPDLANWIKSLIIPVVNRGMKVIIEAGNYFTADSGVLLTKVEYVERMGRGKDYLSSRLTSPRRSSVDSISRVFTSSGHSNKLRSIVVVDMDLNECLASGHRFIERKQIIPIECSVESSEQDQTNTPPATDFLYDIYGPVTDKTDLMIENKSFKSEITAGDILCICDISSKKGSVLDNKNSGRNPAEVLIVTDDEGIKHSQIKKRGTYSDQLNSKEPIPCLNLIALRKSLKVLDDPIQVKENNYTDTNNGVEDKSDDFLPKIEENKDQILDAVDE